MNVVQASPFPAPDLQRCKSAEDCCTAVLDTDPATKFKFQMDLPMRIRPAANSVDAAYAAKIQKAYELMRALPDSDGRSLKNQAKLHCAYCDNNFYFAGNEYPLEIHQSWLFLPWHRLYLYFHERILAQLIGDDSFALPFWYWDDTSLELDSGIRVPELYASQTGYGAPENTNQSMYDPTRNTCALRPNIVDLRMTIFDEPVTEGCPARKTNAEQRSENAHVMYTHMVTGAATTSLFFGAPYRFGDKGGVGAGTLEMKPHSPIHLWVNIAKMITNRLSAADPIFYAHHANVDRLWTIWKTLPGGIRTDPTDRDFLDTQFTFYNEHGKLVHVTVAQSLNLTNLRYQYPKTAIPWATGGVDTLNSRITSTSWPACNNHSTHDVMAMIKTTPPFRAPMSLYKDAVSFRVRRRPGGERRGEEVLQIKGTMNWTLPMSFNAFVNFPEAAVGVPSLQACREYVGSFLATPHVGSSPDIPGKLQWRGALRQKLIDVGAANFTHVVVTLVPRLNTTIAGQNVTITSAKILHINS